MPVVPYSPVANVEPTTQGISPVRIDAPSAAFGTDVAAAIGGLGKAVEGAGNELYARADAMQQLKNESDARDADTQYMIAAGDLHAKYSALEGKAAVDAYPDYAKALQDARIQQRNTLTNPIAQKMYDGNSLSTMGRSIFNGAGHAATENKAYALGTATSQVDLDAKAVEDNPQDDAAFNQKIQKTQANAKTISALKGFDDGGAQEQDLTRKLTSGIWASRITGFAKTDPFAASTYLDAHKTEMTQTDYDRVSNIVQTKGTAVGAVNIANSVFAAHRQPDGTYDATAAEMHDEVKAQATKFDPDNPLLATTAIQKLDGQMNQDRYATRLDLIDTKQTIAQAIRANGITDVQGLLAIPGMDKVVAKLPDTDRNALQGQINRYNAAANKQTNEDTAIRLNGLSNNDVEAFLNTDLTKEHLSKSDMEKFQDKQAKLKANANADPRVFRAMGQIKGAMGSQLQALGIYSRNAKDPDDYDHFTGALSSALDVWEQDHGKPASAKDVTETIAPQLLQQQNVPGRYWGSSQVPFYNAPPPDDFKEKLTTDLKSRGGVEPTDEQVQRAWTRMQYIKLYGGKSKSSE